MSPVKTHTIRGVLHHEYTNLNSTQVFEKCKIAVAIGIDLAKDHCDVVAYNADNKICFTKANMPYPKLRTEI